MSHCTCRNVSYTRAVHLYFYDETYKVFMGGIKAHECPEERKTARNTRRSTQ